MPAGAIHGEESSSSEFGLVTGADWVSGVNQGSVPAMAGSAPSRVAVVRSEERMKVVLMVLV